MRDRVLDLVEKERKANKVEMKGKCSGGGNGFHLRFSGNVQFRRAKRGSSRVWLCFYEGQLTSNCICASTKKMAGSFWDPAAMRRSGAFPYPALLYFGTGSGP